MPEITPNQSNTNGESTPDGDLILTGDTISTDENRYNISKDSLISDGDHIVNGDTIPNRYNNGSPFGRTNGNGNTKSSVFKRDSHQTVEEIANTGTVIRKNLQADYTTRRKEKEDNQQHRTETDENIPDIISTDDFLLVPSDSNMRTGYDFETKYPDLASDRCLICKLLIRNLVELSCGHGFCKDCLQDCEENEK